MGGRGSSSGIKKEEGFQYKERGKTITVQKTSAGIVLVNGKRTNIDYSKMNQAAKKKEGYEILSDEKIKKRRAERYKEFHSHDYELLDDIRKKRKSVYRPRRNK